MATVNRRSFLDHPLARLIALAIFLLCAAAIFWPNREALLPSAFQDPAASDPIDACRSERFAQIDAMVADGMVGEADAELFKQRAEAMCQATAQPPIE